MCSTCGCDSDSNVTFQLLGATDKGNDAHRHTPHLHSHSFGNHHHNHSFGNHHNHSAGNHAHAPAVPLHNHSADNLHSHQFTFAHAPVKKPAAGIVAVEQDILYQNDLLGARNRGYFEAKNILAINMVSSPGSGKTSLLEKTLIDLKEEMAFAVIEGDQQTANDAERIYATGTLVTQINTGKGCHLDAHMVMHALQDMTMEDDAVLFIENVGNLVCPAMFDLGESERVVIISVTEGDDKPLKYPDMFYSSSLCIINKIDLLPYVPFDVEKVKANARKIKPELEFIELSCTSAEGLAEWYKWLKFKSIK